MNVPLRLTRLALSFAALGMLSACGGGGGGDAPAAAAPPPPPPAGSITLTGVVARGAALANASVAVTCATGTGTATTSATGGYSVAISGGALPCVLKATSSDSTLRLHSVAPAGSATSVTANVTPLTELVVARLTGAEPLTYVAAVSASTLAATATASAVAAAQASVAGTLAAGGVNTSTAGDFISGTLVAAVPGTPGNAYDQVLDALNARLTTAGTSLAALTTTIAAGNTTPPVGGGTTSTADTATLPADLLLRPKAANCASLASATYRLIKMAPSPGSTLTTANDVADFNATTLTFTSVSNPADTLRLVANGNCRYTFAGAGGETSDVVVSPAGVIVVRATIGLDDDTVALSARGTTRMIVGLPVQAIAVAELAGDWNAIGWVRNDETMAFEEEGYFLSVASSGALTLLKCGSVLIADAACAVDTAPLPAFSLNAGGGLNLTSTDPRDPYTDRAFTYRAGSGDLMVVLPGTDGSLLIMSKQRTLALPAVGNVTANWNVDLRVSGLAADALYYRTNTVASVNTGAGTLVRNTANDASTVTAPQTLNFNQARSGYFYRPAASVTASNGSTATVRELWAMPLRGFGLTPYYLPATSGSGASSNALFGVSVAKQP